MHGVATVATAIALKAFVIVLALVDPTRAQVGPKKGACGWYVDDPAQQLEQLKEWYAEDLISTDVYNERWQSVLNRMQLQTIATEGPVPEQNITDMQDETATPRSSGLPTPEEWEQMQADIALLKQTVKSNYEKLAECKLNTPKLELALCERAVKQCNANLASRPDGFADAEEAEAAPEEDGRMELEWLRSRHPADHAILHAAAHNFFAGIPVMEVKTVEAILAEHLDGQYPKMLAEIKKAGAVPDDLRPELNSALEEFQLARPELWLSNVEREWQTMTAPVETEEPADPALQLPPLATDITPEDRSLQFEHVERVDSMLTIDNNPEDITSTCSLDRDPKIVAKSWPASAKKGVWVAHIWTASDNPADPSTRRVGRLMADPDGDNTVSLRFVDGQILRLLPLGELSPAKRSEMAEGEAAAWVTAELVREAEAAAVRVEMEPLLASGLPDWVETGGGRQGAAGVAYYSASGETFVLLASKADSLAFNLEAGLELAESHPLPPWLRWATSAEARAAIGPGERGGYSSRWEPEEQRPEAPWVPDGDGWADGSFQEVPKHFFLFADSLGDVTELDATFPGAVSATDTEGTIFAAMEPEALRGIVRESHFGGLVCVVQPGVLSMNSVAGQYHLRTEGAAANDAAHKDAFFDALENALGDTSKDSAAADNAAGASAAPAADGRTAGRDGDDAVDTSDGTKITDPGPGDPRPRVESGGREGVVVMDMRPHHNFVKVRWDGEDSEQTIPAPDDPAAEPAAAEGADADEANVLNAAARLIESVSEQDFRAAEGHASSRMTTGADVKNAQTPNGKTSKKKAKKAKKAKKGKKQSERAEDEAFEKVKAAFKR